MLGAVSKEEFVGLEKGPEEIDKNESWNEELVIEDSVSVIVGV